MSSLKKNQKRLRIENLLLLLVRTALIVVLVLALARPFFSGSIAAALSTHARHYVVVLDNSYSMSANEGVSTPFQRGVDEALRLASGMGDKDTATLYLTNDNFSLGKPGTPRAVLRDTHDPDKLKSVLGKVRVSTGRSRMSEVLAQVAGDVDPHVPNQVLVLITDMQRNTWKAKHEQRGAKDSKEGRPPATERRSSVGQTIDNALDRLHREGVELEVVDVSGSTPGNIAIESLKPLDDRALVAGNPAPFQVRIANYGSHSVDADVRWAIDGAHKGATRIHVPAPVSPDEPGETVARFTFPSLTAGPHAFSARLPTDAVPADDRRIYAADVRKQIHILAVDGDPNGKMGPETYFLKPAIAWKNDRIRMDDVDDVRFESTSLAPYDLVILANVEQIRDRKAAALESFVEKGGALLVFLGDKVDPATTNRLLYKGGKGLLPGRLANRPVVLPMEKSRVHIGLKHPPHPLFSQILGPKSQPGLWDPPRVWGYYPVTPDKDDKSVEVLLRMTDAEKSPALLEKRFGKGKVMLFTTSADMDWGLLPAPGVAVPLLHEMVYYLTARDSGDSNLAPFETFEWQLPPRAFDVRVTTPHGGKQNVAPSTSKAHGPLVEFKDTEEPGLYDLRYDVRGSGAIDAAASAREHLFAVNVDATEGDIRPMTKKELELEFPGIDLHYGQSYTALGSGSKGPPRGEIWKELMAAVLALLFLETFLARRFGATGRPETAKEATS